MIESPRSSHCSDDGLVRNRRAAACPSVGDAVVQLLRQALALGARAVGVGRPYLYGLALAGDEGAAHVLRSILAEADLMMAVNGWPTIADVRSAGAERLP